MVYYLALSLKVEDLVTDLQKVFDLPIPLSHSNCNIGLTAFLVGTAVF